MPSYYDIDAILAEEELLTVKPSFTFAHLSHLDPDSHRNAALTNTNANNKGGGIRKRRRDESEGEHHSLSEGTKIKMPLWAVDRWAMLGFVKIPTLPRHYRQRMKERLRADPVEMNLSAKNDHYFLSGALLTNLLLRAAHVARRHHASTRSSSSTSAQQQLAAMENLAAQARSLQLSLLSTMMGERLCRNFDWTLSALDSMEDDVSSWMGRLSVLERQMFERGVEASGAVTSWREFGCGRMGVSAAVMKGRTLGRLMMGGVGMSPPQGQGAHGGGVNGEKKRVVTPTGGEPVKMF